jgi:hypothetical protein
MLLNVCFSHLTVDLFFSSSFAAAIAVLAVSTVSTATFERAQCMGAEINVEVGMPAQVGAALFTLWGILHIWVGFEGLHQFFSSPAKKQWEMLLGGSRAPVAAFKLPVDALTIRVHSHLLLNFCLDVGGYGFLALFVAWMIVKQASWMAYFIGLFVIGLGDLAFMFLMLTSGIIKPDIYTVGGPVLWILAIIVTPFGMPALS